MFGHYFRNLDDKNRVVIPSKFKEKLGKVFYATIGPEKILVLRDQKSFFVWKDKLLSANSLNVNARNFSRILLGNTIEVTIDNQNRMSIPESFITITSLAKEIAFVGVGNKVELWSKKAFADFQDNFQDGKSLDELAKKLFKDGVQL